MTRIRLRFIQQWVDREGRVHRYFRRPGYPRVPLPGLPGSAEFMDAYRAALDGPQLGIGVAKRSKPGSVSMAIAAYYGAPDFTTLAPGTKTVRRAILERFRHEHGDKPIALLPQKFIAVMLSKMKPHAARNWLKALRGLLQFTIALEMRADDPTQGIKLPRIGKSDGFYTWSEEDITAYETHHAIGTKARLALALPLFTAQRRADIIRMGRQHIRDGALTIRQNKTGRVLTIPLHPDLQAIIDATPGDHLTFLVTRSGRPYSASDFSEQFRKWCDAAGLPACSVHGLRKAACRRLAEAGCSMNEIAAISGHASLREIARYTKAADQAHLARNAMARTTAENSKRTASVKLSEI
jgi:integrase